MDRDFIITLSNLAILGLTAYIAFRRSGVQNALDGTSSMKNLNDLTISLQAQLKEVRDENKEIRGILDRAHLMVTLGIEIGKKPEVIAYEWCEGKEEDQIG